MGVATLMAYIIDPQQGESLYDPTSGSGGLLVKSQLRLAEKVAAERGIADPHDLPPDAIERPLRLFGQEILPTTYAMGRMNAFLHDMTAEIALGDTMRSPKFTRDGQLQTFDKVVANPMWNQTFPTEVYENDTYGRFARGTPPGSSADWGWIQHMEAGLNEGSNRERDIRAKFVEQGLVEAVILLPENLFYNTSAPGHNPRHPHGQPAPGRDPADQRRQAPHQGPPQERADARAHPADRAALPRLAGREGAERDHQ